MKNKALKKIIDSLIIFIVTIISSFITIIAIVQGYLVELFIVILFFIIYYFKSK